MLTVEHRQRCILRVKIHPEPYPAIGSQVSCYVIESRDVLILSRMFALRYIAAAGIVFCLFACAGHAQNINNGLVGHYLFNNTAGDSSSQSPINHGTEQGGTTYACGVLDSAIVFDGTNDRVELDSNFYVDSAWSVSMWVNPHTVHEGTMFAMRKQCTNTGRGWERFSYRLSGTNSNAYLNNNAAVTVTNQLLMAHRRCASNCNGWSNQYMYTIPGLSIDTLCFTHIVITVDSNSSNANRNYRVYINGQYYIDTVAWIPPANNLANTVDPFSINASDFTTFFGIAHDNFSYGNQQLPYDGALDHVRVYNREVSAAEALLLYQEGLPSPLSLTYSDTVLCSSETDTVSAPTLSDCSYFYWMINDSVVSSTDTFLVMTSGGSGLDTVSLVYSPHNLCLLDTIQVVYSTGGVDSTYDTLNICAHDSAFLGGAWQYNTGTYADTFASSGLCDSVVYTYLNVISNIDTINVSLCPGDTFIFNGNVLTSSGQFSDTTTGAICDSITLLNLNIGNTSADLVGFYPLGSNGNDSSSMAPLNNGTLNGGVTFGQGVVGNAAFFDGTNDRIELDTNFQIDTTYTFSAWIKPSSAQNGSLFCMRSQCQSATHNGWDRSNIILISPGSTNIPPLGNTLPQITVFNQLSLNLSRSHIVCANGWGNSHSYTVTGISIDTTCWTHIVVAVTENYSNSLRNVTAYINGTPHTMVLYKVPTAANMSNATDPFDPSVTGFETHLGFTHKYSNNNKNFPYRGGMDHVKIYRRAIDSCEAITLYQEVLDTAALQILGWNNITCTGLSDTLTYTSTGDVFDIEWYLNGTQIGTSDSLQLEFDTAGSYQVDLVHTSDLFCIDDTFSVAYFINPPDSSFDTLQICVGDSAFLEGSWQHSDGWYVDSTTTSMGCDSVIMTHLVLEYFTDTLDVSICQGEVFQVNGVNQSTSGYYPDTISGNGCDTIRYVHLIVIAPVVATQTIQMCVGDSLQVGGAFQYINGTYADTTQSLSTGCDSVTTTTLNFQYYTDTVGLSICLGEQIEINGVYQNTSGYYPDTLTGAPCDTLRYFHLTVVSPVVTTHSIQLCHGDSFLAGGAYQLVSGLYHDSLTTTSGCDSIVATYLTFYYEQRNVHHIMCEGETYVFYGDTLSIQGTYTRTAAGLGCDTLVTLDLDWITPTFSYRELDVCIGDSVLIGGMWYSDPATVTDTLVSAVGCDSIRTSVLSFYQAESHLKPIVCAGEVYAPSGQSYMQDTTFRDTAFENGCLVKRLHEIEVIPYKTGTEKRAICQEDSLFLAGAWQTNQGLYPDTFTSQVTGCDSIRWTDLTVVLLSKEIEEITICRDDSLFAQGAYQHTSGIYYDTVSEPNEPCRIVIETHLTVLNMPLQHPEIIVLDSGSCPRPQFELDAGVNPPGIFWDNQENTRIIKTKDTGWIHLEYLFCNHRLKDSLYLPWRDCSCFIYFPNSFTPDDDGINDLFRPIHECPFHDYELTLFDRWGHVVFKTTDPFKGWDGKSYGIPSPIGSYAFHFRYRFDPEAPFLYKYGQVILFR